MIKCFNKSRRVLEKNGTASPKIIVQEVQLKREENSIPMPKVKEGKKKVSKKTEDESPVRINNSEENQM